MAYGVQKPLYTSVEIEWTAYTHSLEAYEQLMCPCIRFLSVNMSQEDQAINSVQHSFTKNAGNKKAT